MIERSKRKRLSRSGELEVSGYFYTGWGGEGEEDIPDKKATNWLVWFTLLFLFFFFLRISYLQIWQGSYYQAKAETNRVKTIYVDAPRGLIYDRDHKPIATNSPQFDLVMIPGLVPKGEVERKELFSQVESVTGIAKDELESRYVENKADSFDFIVLIEDIQREKALNIETQVVGWEGVLLEGKAKRNYPYGEMAPHVLGYTRKISKEELAKKPNYLINDFIGKEGLEAQYEKNLRGKKGERQLEVDSMGKVTRVVGSSIPEVGKSIVLSLDIDLQQAAYEGLRDSVAESEGTGGAVVAIDPRNGSILALVSYPSFDNNKFIGKLSPEDLSDMINSENRILFNRAIGGTYPPGSTFKPLVAAAALEEKIVTPQEELVCPETISVGQWSFKDWKYHGDSNLDKAIAESVNTYFYIIGGGWGDKKGLGVDKIESYAKSAGFGEQLGIDIPQEAQGVVPGPEWKKEVLGENWYIGDTYHVSIGQGGLSVTPLQLAVYVSAMVNGGDLYQPHLLDYIENHDGEVIDKNKPITLRKDIFSQNTLEAVKKSMKTTVFSETGSGRRLKTVADKYGVDIGGKTGTAQFSREEKYHAWFTGFAPVENPEIVVVTLIEKGGEGYVAALPVAERILDKYLEKRN